MDMRLFLGCLLLMVFLIGCGDCSQAMNLSLGTMILPLVSAKVDNFTARGFLRHLTQENSQLPAAHMRLYDELLTNGYYTTRLMIGTPPQKFALIVDSGSTVTYVPCSTCTHCGNHQDPKFQPEKSSTYQPVKCGLDCSNCNIEKNQCRYERQYAEMSSSSGVLGEDVMTFGEDSGLGPQRATFGCEDSETGDLYNQLADGIIGLGRGHLSIMDQLVNRGVIADSFSLCYGGMDIGGGAMVLGSITPPSGMVFTKSDPNRSPYYNIELKGIRVAGELLPLNPQVFNGRHGTVLDSGTTYAYLPESAFVAFKNAVIKKIGSLKQIPGPDPSYHDICFSGAGSDVSQLSNKFPSVELVFGKMRTVTLAPENYLFRHSKVHGAYCLGVFQNGKDQTTLLGGIVVRNMLVTYDRAKEKIGFWKTNCSKLRETFQVTVPSPPPQPEANTSISNSTHSDKVLTPTPLPSPSVSDFQEKIGGIELYISLSVKPDEFQPHSREFKQDMARELAVSFKQIQLLNVSNSEESVNVGIAVFPSASNNYMTNATAEKIVSLLSGHQAHLRDAFRTYHLLSWRALPPLKRTWIQKHLALVAVSIVFVIVILSMSLLYWHFRRQKHEALGLYRTVDAVIQEEELQPL